MDWFDKSDKQVILLEANIINNNNIFNFNY
jgi:hypothetical protein